MNRKQRNLRYIRAKNNLRLGKVDFYYSEKVSERLRTDEFDFDNLLLTATKSLFKIYKLKPKSYELKIGYYMEDDFANGLITHAVAISC